jgi:type II secretory ATPase GspE/PulE/Tfp pilus assembly ATPase PilB-like protein
VVVAEILVVDRELDELISNSASRNEMLDHALKKGFAPMIEDGLQKVIEGIIDLKELMRAVDMTDRMN